VGLSAKNKILAIFGSCLVLIIRVSPGYLYTESRIAKGFDQSEVKHVTSEIHNNAGYHVRFTKSIEVISRDVANNYGKIFVIKDEESYRLVKTSVFCGLIVTLFLVASGIVRRGGRLFAGVSAAYFLVWSLFYSYSLRNLIPVLPWLSLAMSHGVATNFFGMRKLVSSMVRVKKVTT
jgi:hypothetical protein